MAQNQTITVPGKIFIKPDLFYMCYVCGASVKGKHLKHYNDGHYTIWVCNYCAEGLKSREEK